MANYRTGLVVVSHSADLAKGVTDLVGSFSPTVVVKPCGGTPAGEIGISKELITKTLADAKAQLGADSSVIVLADLGSTMLAVSSVIEAGSDGHVVLARGPLVEGALAGAAEIASGGSVESVLDAILQAAAGWTVSKPKEEDAEDGPDDGPRRIVIRAKVDAHVAAKLSRDLMEFDAQVTVNDADASSVLALMRLGLDVGQPALVRASGPDALEALDMVEKTL